MPDIPEVVKAVDEAAHLARGGGGLSHEAAQIMSGVPKGGLRPAEFDFQPASINGQVDKALGLDQGKPPWYAQYPAEQRFGELTGSKHAPFDVVIAGAGLFGTQTARVLAEQGLKVAVVEGGHVADGASGALAGMGTRGLDASFPELREAMGDPAFATYVQNTRAASKAIQSAGAGLPETRIGISSHMLAYPDGDGPVSADLREEFKALHPFDPATRWSTGERAAKIFPALGDRPAAGSVMSFLDESRVNPRALSLSLLDHPNISTFEHSPVIGIRTGLPGEPLEIHTADGVVKTNKFVSAIGGLPTMFEQHVPLLSAEQARMIRGALPDGATFSTHNFFDFGNPVSRNDEDYAWWLMPNKGEVYIGADSRFLTDGDRATTGLRGLRENAEFTFPGIKLDHNSKSWGSVIYGTEHGGPMVGTLPGHPDVIFTTGGGGTGLINGRQAAWNVRALVAGGKVNPIYTPSYLEHMAAQSS